MRRFVSLVLPLRSALRGGPRARVAGTLALFLALGCDSLPTPTDAGGVDAGPPAGPPAPIFDVNGAFFDAPYPSDLRTDAEGRPVLQGFPFLRGLAADGAALVEGERPGFSNLTGVYFRFSAPIQIPDPDPARRESADSPVWLVDVDPDSPSRGERLPAYATFYAEPSRVWPGNCLVVRPVAGRHLHPGRRYAAVIRDSIDPALEPSPAFEALKAGGGSGPEAAHYAELFETLEELGLPREDVAIATMFTTMDPAVELDAARAYVLAQPRPTLRDWQVLRVSATELRVQATFDTYELLEGDPPYADFGSGRLRMGADGMPTAVDRRPVRVGISVPVGDPPAEGHPTVLYGHGTGGDHESHLGRESTALAEVGVATLGLEAVLHGERSPVPLEVENLIAQNPVAAREVVRQTVLDMILLFAMLEEGGVVIPAELNEGTPIPLASAPAMYMGHSQGSQEAGVLLGVEPRVSAAFLSAGGMSGIITVNDRELSPGNPIRCLLGTILNESCDAMTEDHPAITLIVQPILEPADPTAFAHRFLRERPTDWAPLSVAMTEGLMDTFTSPRGIEALAVAIGLPIVEPVHQSTDAFTLVGTPTVAPPATGNLTAPGGEAVTGGVMQFPDDGHFAIYRNDDATNRYVEFFRTYVTTGQATLVGPM